MSPEASSHASPSPRRWWAGPLDVEGLAWSAGEEARTATQRLAEARRQPHRVSTSPALVAASFAAIDHLRVDGRPAQGWAPLSGFHETGSGWVRLHANYPHHAAAISRAVGACSREDLPAALAPMTASQVETAVVEAGGVAVAVRSTQEWAGHAQARATAGDPWVSVHAADERPALRGGRLPLDGVRVLDLTRVVAGPSCSQLLACLGADVLRVDPPWRPELLDQHLSTGMGKRSAALDLRRRALEGLLPAADVVLLGYRPGSLDRFGLAPQELLSRRPHLVVATLSAWGESGPWGHRAGFDSVVQAATGIATACSTGGDGAPGTLPVQALDHATGYRTAAAVVDLLARGRAGVVRASLLGAARTLLDAPPPPAAPPAALPVPRVRVTSLHGTLTAVPPPLLLDGRTLERAVGRYGASSVSWG